MKTIGICIAGKVDFDLNLISSKFNIEAWIAVDGGYNHLYKQEIKPKILIGDMDSINYEFDESIKFPTEKDETDFELAINYVNKNYHNTRIIVCGVYDDERLEHFISNLKLMTDQMIFVTKHNLIYQYSHGEYKIQAQDGGFSLFAKEVVQDLTIKNAKYELDNYHLEVNNSLTISNEFTSQYATVSFSSGTIQLFLKNNL